MFILGTNEQHGAYTPVKDSLFHIVLFDQHPFAAIIWKWYSILPYPRWRKERTPSSIFTECNTGQFENKSAYFGRMQWQIHFYCRCIQAFAGNDQERTGSKWYVFNVVWYITLSIKLRLSAIHENGNSIIIFLFISSLKLIFFNDVNSLYYWRIKKNHLHFNIFRILYPLLKVARRSCETLFATIYFKFYTNIIENMHGHIESVYSNLSSSTSCLMAYIQVIG